MAANLILDKEPQLNNEHLKPSYVFTIGGVKVGIVGYLTPETKEVASPNNVEFIDEIEAIKYTKIILYFNRKVKNHYF